MFMTLCETVSHQSMMPSSFLERIWTMGAHTNIIFHEWLSWLPFRIFASQITVNFQISQLCCEVNPQHKTGQAVLMWPFCSLDCTYRPIGRRTAAVLVNLTPNRQSCSPPGLIKAWRVPLPNGTSNRWKTPEVPPAAWKRHFPKGSRVLPQHCKSNLCRNVYQCFRSHLFV